MAGPQVGFQSGDWTTVHINSGVSLDAAIRELDKWGVYGPDRVVKDKLNMVAREAFAATQTATHVITASLKLSGRYQTDSDFNDWTVDIMYGGPSAGPNNPVDYAIYEMARGGSHDFLAPVYGFYDQFEDAIADFIGD